MTFMRIARFLGCNQGSLNTAALDVEILAKFIFSIFSVLYGILLCWVVGLNIHMGGALW